MLRVIAWVIFILLFGLTVTLTIPNAHLVPLNYYTGSVQIHLTVLLLITLALGIWLGIFFNLMWVWHLWRENQRLKQLQKPARRKND